MSVEIQSCPESKTLSDFLLGRLSSEQLSSYEDHLAQCPPCNETIRSLNVNDTFSDLAKGAFADDSSHPDLFIENANEQAALSELVERLKSLGGGATRSTRFAERYETETTAARAEEVQRLFDVDESDGQSLGRLAHYRVEQFLGAGSTGVVYLATDENLDRPVALKILRPSLGQAARDRFVAEARATAAISATNVVSIYHVGTVGELAYIAMQWTPGETLQTRLKRDVQLPMEDVREIGRQVASGLASAHQIGLIHRDIKPANIWIESESGVVKILDFGLVRATDGDPQLTCTGMIAGTPCYMSPEQSRGAKLDCRSDFFSLGCLLYESLTGELPFRSTNVLATLQSIQRDEPTPPHEFNPKIPRDLSTLVISLLEKSPTDRPPTAESVEQAIGLPVENWAFEPKRKFKKPKRASEGNGNRVATGWIGWASGIAACALLVVGSLMHQQIIRIATNQGELVIETNDPDLKIEIIDDGGQVRIIDLKTEQAIEIVAGKYELRPHSDLNSIEIDQQTIVMKRGDKQIVKVTRNQTPLNVAVNQESTESTTERHAPATGELANHVSSAADPTKRKERGTIPPDYKLGTADVLGVFIEGLLSTNEPEPSGFPMMVMEAGDLVLPNVKPIRVAGKTVGEAQALVKSEYLDAENPVLQPGSYIGVRLLKKRPTLGEVQTIDTPIIPFAPSQPSQIAMQLKEANLAYKQFRGQFTGEHPSLVNIRRHIGQLEKFLAESRAMETSIIQTQTDEYEATLKRVGHGDKQVKKQFYELMELLKGEFVYELNSTCRADEMPSEINTAEALKAWQTKHHPELAADLTKLQASYQKKLVGCELDKRHPFPASLRNRIYVLNAMLEGFASQKIVNQVQEETSDVEGTDSDNATEQYSHLGINTIRARIVELEVIRIDLDLALANRSEIFGPNHKDMVSLNKQIDSSAAELNDLYSQLNIQVARTPSNDNPDFDPEFRELEKRITEKRLEIEKRKQVFGPEHASLKLLNTEIELIENAMARIKKSLLPNFKQSLLLDLAQPKSQPPSSKTAKPDLKTPETSHLKYELRGKCTIAQNAPAGQADLFLYRVTNHGADRELIAATNSLADGSFTIPGLELIDSLSIRYTLACRLGGHASLRRDVEPKHLAPMLDPNDPPEAGLTGKKSTSVEQVKMQPDSSSQNTDLTISFSKAVPIRGTITDHDGNPVSDMTVYRLWLAEGSIPGFGETKTEANGKFYLDDIAEIKPDKLNRAFYLYHPDHGNLEFMVQEIGETEFDIQLPQTTRFSGRVVDQVEKPVANFRLAGQTRHPERASLESEFEPELSKLPDNIQPANVRGSGWFSFVTDQAGRFNVVVPRGSDHNLFSYQNDSKLVMAAVEITSHGEAPLVELGDVNLITPVEVVGKVVDAETAADRPNVHIGWHGPDRPDSSAAIGSAISDAEGKFTARLVPGKHTIYVAMHGLKGSGQFRRDGNDEWLPLSSELMIAPDDSIELRFLLHSPK